MIFDILLLKTEKNVNIDILIHFKIIINSLHANISSVFYVNNLYPKKISDKGALNHIFYISFNA